MLISNKIDRYNDNYYLRFTGTQFLKQSQNETVIKDNDDWSLSFFLSIEGNGTRILFDSRSVIGIDGIYILIDNTIGFNTISFNRGFGGGNQASTSFQSTGLRAIGDNSICNICITFDSLTKDMSLYVDSVLREVLNVSYTFKSSTNGFCLGAFNPNPTGVGFKYQGGIRDFCLHNSKLNNQEIKYIYNLGLINDVSYINNVHNFPLNDRPYESGGNYYMKDVCKNYNPTATNSDIQLTGWSDSQLGVTDHTTATSWNGWNTKTQSPINEGYLTGLNILPTQSLTFNGLNIGDKMVVNYDELGISKQDIVNVNAINFTYSNVNPIKIRLVTVVSNSDYQNNRVYKTIFNNGILRSGILSSYNEVISAETNLKSPIDDAGTLKFPDLSVNNIDIVANGWANLTDLQNSIN